jgi:hypothetical protein
VKDSRVFFNRVLSAGWNGHCESSGVLVKGIGAQSCPCAVAFPSNWWDNQGMKHHEGERHPGPFRVMRVDAESAGILVAVAFWYWDWSVSRLQSGFSSEPLPSGWELLCCFASLEKNS